MFIQGRLKNVIFVMFFIVSQLVFAQDIRNIQEVNVDELSDKQIEKFWNKAQDEGYTLKKIVVYARVKGMPDEQIEKLRERIEYIQEKNKNKDRKKKYEEENDGEEYEDEQYEKEESEWERKKYRLKEKRKFGLTGEENDSIRRIKDDKDEKDLVFGYKFFQNPNISFTPNINLATPKNYRLGPGDLIQIDLWGAVEEKFKVKVSNGGTIKLPSVGIVTVNGLTLEKATAKINSKLRRIYAGIGSPTGSYNKVYSDITLADIRTVQVNIIGEIKTPGTYSLSGLSTVLNALYAAGGPNENGSLRTIKVIRQGTKIADFDVYKYITTGSEEGNVQLQDQDVVIIPPYINRVTIAGEVKRKGIFELTQKETFKELLEYAGGFTADAYKKNIIIERNNDIQKEIKEFGFSQSNQVLIKNGDKVLVRKITDKYTNRVILFGSVYHPGNYEFIKGMTLKGLLNKASGIKDEAYLDKSVIIRKIDEQDKKAISFSLREILNGTKDIDLKEEDQIYVYSKDELREDRYVEINGAVNTPNKFNYMEGLSVEDVIALAGGFKEGADPSNIEIARRLKDDDLFTVAQSIVVSVNENLSDTNKKRILQPYDIITVRYQKGFTVQKSIKVTGEVHFPGIYTLRNKEEKISDIIRRAGGVTPYAYVKGATLVRKKEIKEKKEEENTRDDVLELIKKRDSLFGSVEPDITEFKIGIRLEKILKEKKAETDLVLIEGDEIIVPKKKMTIEVQGMVFSPSLIQYRKEKGLKYYINNAGGFSHKAKKNKVFVVYQNGSIATTKNFLFFKKYPKIEPGATVLVPEKPTKKKLLSVQEIIGLTTGFTSLIILLDRLIK